MNLSSKIAKVHNFSLKQMGSDTTGHGFDHILRVVNLTKKILKSEPGNPLIAISAAYLHDVADDKLVKDPAAQNVKTIAFLKESDFSDDEITEILDITKNLSFSKSLGQNPPILSISGKIVQDADRLDAIGAIGTLRAIYYGGKNSQVIYDPTVKPRTSMDKTEYRNLSRETIINHFYEKLLNLKAMMNTNTARKIAAGRQTFMLNFLEEFLGEWNGKL
ncbi:HD domain-containing protein [Lactobacillus sp. UCMA15818]|uniref:HD domain-containing protein n=1 Tax=Lactobacillaceae TaxID=33958 RepID=UPI0025B08DF0|nr:HD domain-containing protein [Lactobacillus sp. UCMA15818]MDN2453774.1 HD domain-containing protein [Lactobacillus sp. UCMA15818]